jgi:hypothetical protein
MNHWPRGTEQIVTEIATYDCAKLTTPEETSMPHRCICRLSSLLLAVGERA